MKLVSFDVFDTCLVRLCGTPDNFFDVLSHKVFTRPVDEATRREFVFRRRLAEVNCSKNATATIFDFYDAFDYAHPFLIDKNELASVEIGLEQAMLVPVSSTLEMIARLRAKGARIVFISDMYLPGSIIEEMLRKAGFFEDGDKLYVSCEVGKTKASGELYDFVRGQEGVSFRQWRHFGDNFFSDYYTPKGLGIKAKKISVPYGHYPKRWCQFGGIRSFNYPGILAGLSRALLCSRPVNDRSAFLVDFVGPLYCSFVSNVLKDARERGISRLYFCARDTFQMFKVAQVLGEDYPEISLHYLYISRASLYDSDKEMLLGYLKQEGVISNEGKVAIVDTTTWGKTLSELNKIARECDVGGIFGYFMLKFEGSLSVQIPEPILTSMLKSYYRLSSLQYATLWSKVPLIENYMSSNTQKRTVAYKKSSKDIYEPIYDCHRDDSEQDFLEYWEQYYGEILSVCAKAYRLLELGKYSDELLGNVILPTLCDFLLIPEKKYLKGFTSFSSCQMSGEFRPLVKKESFVNLCRTRGLDTDWRIATMILSLPDFLSRWYVKKKLRIKYE